MTERGRQAREFRAVTAGIPLLAFRKLSLSITKSNRRFSQVTHGISGLSALQYRIRGAALHESVAP